jgi:serine-type D-Ala-D-Ala carboxypeptidase/endopeptidase
MKRIAAVVLVLASPISAVALDLRASFEPLARRLVDDRAAPGLVVGIVKDGETQVVGYGEVRKGSGVAPDGDTVYEIGSITKTFSATLLGDMIARGAVQLDAPIDGTLPVKLPLKDARPITLEHLITHTSGYPRWPENMRAIDKHNPSARYTVADTYEFLNGYKLRRAPGQFEYSNFGFGLVGQVLSLRSAKTYEELLVERICDPLGMRDTRQVASADMLKRLAPPYNDVLQEVGNMDLGALQGAGGIRSTANDMLKYLRAHLAADDTPLGRAMRLTHARHYTSKGAKGELAKGQGIGLAWRMTRDDRILFHGGSTLGYRAWTAIVPDRGVAIIVLANSASGKIYPFGDRLLHIVLGDRVPATAETAAPE